MSAVERAALEASPLADLHTLAGALKIDGFRRLRKAELIRAIMERQGVDPGEPTSAEGEDAPAARPARRPRRRRAGADDDAAAPAAAATKATPAAAEPENTAAGEPERTVEGTVELLANGSGFLRMSPPEPSDEDVYVSAAQARRCELVSGDRVSGPVRPARRSERYPSLIRVATINGAQADEVVRGTRIEELEVDFPSVPLALGEDDPTLAAIDLLAPFGRGSRVTVCGPPRSGKSEAVKRIAGVLAEVEGIDVEVLLVGIRPEELSEWKASTIASVSGHTFAASTDVRVQAIDQAVERGRRIAVRGGDAVLLIDTLDGVEPGAARRALAAARNLREGGSLTIIATAAAPCGGESTVIALDAERVAAGSLPAVDPLRSGTVRAEVLVGLERFQAGNAARAEQLKR
ncbi:MAG: transcription termination factor Rho [Solirubrobacteraceae bacterium]